MTTYQVFQPATSEHHLRLTVGAVISTHRTPLAAARKIDTSMRRLVVGREIPAAATWLGWVIRAWQDGQARWLTDAEWAAANERTCACGGCATRKEG